MLLQTYRLGDDESGTAKCRITTGDWSRNHTQQSQDTTGYAQPAGAYYLHHSRRIKVLNQRLTTIKLSNKLLRHLRAYALTPSAIVEEIHRHRSPDQGNDTLGNHRTIEDGTPHLLVLHTSSHQRTLGSMKTTDSATGNGNKETWEERTLLHERLRAQPRRVLVEIGRSQITPQLRQGRPLHEQSYHQRSRHEKQREGKERIYLANNLIDRQQRGNDVVDEDDDNPEHLSTQERARVTNAIENDGRTIHKHCTHHHQQQHGEHQHHFLGSSTQILAHQFRQTSSIVADTEHTTHIIVHGSCKDTSEDNPQISHRTIPRTHDGSKNWSSTRNIEKLNHKDFPTRQHHEVDTVGFGHCRRRAVVRTEHMRHKLSIKKIAQNKGHQTDDETDHFLLLLIKLLSF